MMQMWLPFLLLIPGAWQDRKNRQIAVWQILLPAAGGISSAASQGYFSVDSDGSDSWRDSVWRIISVRRSCRRGRWTDAGSAGTLPGRSPRSRRGIPCADSSYFMGNDSDSEKEADGEDTDRLSAVSLACGRDLCSCRRIREWIVGSG